MQQKAFTIMVRLMEPLHFLIDLTVDNYTQALNGCVRLVINSYFDAAVLRSEAFAFGQTAE